MCTREFTGKNSKEPIMRSNNLELLRKQLRDKAYLSEWLKIENNRRKWCYQCENVFSSASVNKRHYYSVHVGSRFICDICNQSCTHKINLTVHIKASHSTNRRPFTCSRCNLLFTRKSVLKMHFKVKHLGLSRICPICLCVRHYNNIHSHLKLCIRKREAERIRTSFEDLSFNICPCDNGILLGNGNVEPTKLTEQRCVADKIQNQHDCVCNVYDLSSAPTYYSHLGASASLAGITKLMATRLEVNPSQINVLEVGYKEMTISQRKSCKPDCTVISRTNSDEKALVIVRSRESHYCATKYMVVAICIWNAIPQDLCKDFYTFFRDVHPKNKVKTTRGCSKNPRNPHCECQGTNSSKDGCTFSFGCAYHRMHTVCKWAKALSNTKKKFPVKGDASVVKDKIDNLESMITPIVKSAIPCAYRNMTKHSLIASCCRLGKSSLRPFAAVTINKGAFQKLRCEKVVSFTKHKEGEAKPQLHVLCEATYGESHGVAIKPTDGSLLIESAKLEKHQSTALSHPDKTNPQRISLVFFQHRFLHYPLHGQKIFRARKKNKF